MRFNPRPLAPAAPVALLLALLWALAGCQRDGRAQQARAQLERAEALYQQRLARGVHPRDGSFDAVIEAYEAVPPGTEARRQADARLQALRALRGPLPPRPLATPAAPGPHLDEVEAQRAACEALVKQLAATPAEARAPVRQQLAACSEKLTRLEAHAHPEKTPDAGR